MNNISYIIPHFNSFEKVCELLNSIVLKEKDEILIIDDCSTDDSYIKLVKLREKIRFKLFKTEKNGGAGCARNIGIEKSKNEWLIFADSDDNFIEGYRKNVDLYLDSEADVVYFRPTSIKVTSNKSVVGDRHGFYSYLIERFINDSNPNNLNNLKYKMVVPWSKMINSKFVKKNEIYFDEVSVSNDVMFSTKIGFYSEKVDVSSDILYCCVELNTSMTADTSYEKTFERLIIYSKQYDFLKRNLNQQEFKKLGLTGLSYFLLGIKSNFTFNQFKEIVIYLKKKNIPIISLYYVKQRFKRYRFEKFKR